MPWWGAYGRAEPVVKAFGPFFKSEKIYPWGACRVQIFTGSHSANRQSGEMCTWEGGTGWPYPSVSVSVRVRARVCVRASGVGAAGEQWQGL